MVLLAALFVVPACGRTGPPDPNELRDVTVQIALPDGASFGALTLSTPYGAGPVTNGAGAASITGHGPALASVESGNDTLLLGWVSEEMAVLSTRTTAEALSFYYLNGQFLEPAMQLSLLDMLTRHPALNPVTEAVRLAVIAEPPNVTLDDDGIAAALADMAAILVPEATAEIAAQNLTISPDYQQSGISVRETAPLTDVINVYNAFKRPVHVFVDRHNPSPGPVVNFALEGARVEDRNSADSYQHFNGFASGSVSRHAVRSENVAVPGNQDETTTYRVTVVGAGGDVLSGAYPASVVQTAKDVAMRTAVERFLAPTISSALALGAPERLVDNFDELLEGLSTNTIDQIQEGDFATGINDAFAELFNSSALPTTLQRLLAIYYDDIVLRDNPGALIARVMRSLSPLVGATAKSVSSVGSGIISTIKNSKRVEVITVLARTITLRITPAESTIGTGGQVVLTTNVRFPEGVNPANLTYRYSLSGALAGYATDGTTDKALPFETSSTVITYKHRDTININYGTDVITVEALQDQGGTQTVVATGTASVTVKESTITLSPQNAELDFGSEQTFTATVDPVPESGTLHYIFVTYGPSAFAGGSQTSVGTSNSVVFVQAATEEGTVQPVTVTVVLDNDGVQTVLGQTQASAKFKGGTSYILAASSDGTGGIGVDDALEVKLNGTVIYTDGTTAHAGTRPPIQFSAEVGDTLTIEVRDTVGVCRGLSALYLVKGDRSVVVDPGFKSCGHPLGNHGVVHTRTFKISF